MARKTHAPKKYQHVMRCANEWSYMIVRIYIPTILFIVLHSSQLFRKANEGWVTVFVVSKSERKEKRE
jgi:hypothetical protein